MGNPLDGKGLKSQSKKSYGKGALHYLPIRKAMTIERHSKMNLLGKRLTHVINGDRGPFLWTYLLVENWQEKMSFADEG